MGVRGVATAAESSTLLLLLLLLLLLQSLLVRYTDKTTNKERKRQRGMC
jgi:hypothetical protein